MIFASRSLGAVAVFLVATSGCSSSSDSPSSDPGTDTGGVTIDSSAKDSAADASSGDSVATDTSTGTDTAVDDTTTGDAKDGGGTCGSDPTLHPLTATDGGFSGVFCPGAGAGGDSGSSSKTCDPGLFCCDTPSGSTPASSCIASTATCPTTSPKAGATWECDAPQHCGTGKVCCGQGTPKLRTGCTYEEVFPALGSKCEATCGATEYIICEAPADCPSGKTCTPIKNGGKQVGYCK